MITVDLSPSELLLAATSGVMRQIYHTKKGTPNRYGITDDKAWNAHIEGACGECAVAKWLGVYWSGHAGDVGLTDVFHGQGVEVRTTNGERNRLILHPSDHDDKPYILVVGAVGHYELKGWVYGKEGKRETWWSDPSGNGRHAFFVPQHALRKMDELKGIEDKVAA